MKNNVISSHLFDNKQVCSYVQQGVFECVNQLLQLYAEMFTYAILYSFCENWNKTLSCVFIIFVITDRWLAFLVQLCTVDSSV